MNKSLLGAVALALALAGGAAAQQQPDPMQGMLERMRSMEQMLESMQSMMQSMHGGAEDQAMPGMGAMHGMMGMAMPEQASPSCGMAGMDAGFGALLGGCAMDLALTEAQRATLEEILARARTEALAALTPEQRERVSAPGAMGAMCPAAGREN